MFQCEGENVENYVNWLVVSDRLAPADNYASYGAQPYTCRAYAAPDALNINVTGIKNIEVDQFEMSMLR